MPGLPDRLLSAGLSNHSLVIVSINGKVDQDHTAMMLTCRQTLCVRNKMPSDFASKIFQSSKKCAAHESEVSLLHPVPDFKDSFRLHPYSLHASTPSALECTLIFHVTNTETHTHLSVGKSLQHSVQPG